MGKIVWLASYPKSGNTWMRAFLHNYIARPAAPQSINALTEFSAVECAAAFFGETGRVLSTEEAQRLRPAMHERLTRLHDDLVFVKTHNANLAVHGVRLCTPAQTAGALYLVRDPRDVALSYAAFTGRSCDEIIELMGHEGAANRASAVQVFEYMSSWSAHVASWAAGENTLITRFEDLCAEPERYFGRVIRFLGGTVEPERLRRAVEFSAFKVLAAQEADEGYSAKGDGPGPFFRAGETGGWRRGLSAAQRARIEKDHGAIMTKLGYL